MGEYTKQQLKTMADQADEAAYKTLLGEGTDHTGIFGGLLARSSEACKLTGVALGLRMAASPEMARQVISGGTGKVLVDLSPDAQGAVKEG